MVNTLVGLQILDCWLQIRPGYFLPETFNNNGDQQLHYHRTSLLYDLITEERTFVVPWISRYTEPQSIRLRHRLYGILLL